MVNVLHNLSYNMNSLIIYTSWARVPAVRGHRGWQGQGQMGRKAGYKNGSINGVNPVVRALREHFISDKSVFSEIQLLDHVYYLLYSFRQHVSVHDHV